MAECVATVTLGGGFVVGRGSEAELGSSIGIFSYFLQGCCDDTDFDKTNAPDQIPSYHDAKPNGSSGREMTGLLWFCILFVSVNLIKSNY